MLMYIGIVVGLIVSVFGIISYVKDFSTFDWPLWLWFTIGLLIMLSSFALLVVKMIKDKKALKKQLVSKSANVELIKHRQEIRKDFHDRLEIPSLLNQLFERCIQIAKENKDITMKEYNERSDEINAQIRKLGYMNDDSPMMNLLRYMSSLENIHQTDINIDEVRQFDSQFHDYLIDIQGVLANKGIGVLLLSKHDDEYQVLLSSLEKLRVGLPQAIDANIEKYLIQICAISNLFALEMLPSHFKAILPNLEEVIPYFEDAVKAFPRKLNATILSQIEEHLAGEGLE